MSKTVRPRERQLKPINESQPVTRLRSVPDVAELCQVSTKKIWRDIYERKLGTIRLGRRVLVSEEQLHEYLSAAEVPRLDAVEIARRILSA